MTKTSTPKLIRYDRTNVIFASKVEPTIAISINSLWRFNKSACAHLKLKAGQQVAIFQDPAEPRDWYIAVVHADGFELRPKDTCMEFNCKELKATLFRSLEWDNPCGTMSIGMEPLKHDGLTLWPIITSSIKYQPRKRKG